MARSSDVGGGAEMRAVRGRGDFIEWVGYIGCGARLERPSPHLKGIP